MQKPAPNVRTTDEVLPFYTIQTFDNLGGHLLFIQQNGTTHTASLSPPSPGGHVRIVRFSHHALGFKLAILLRLLPRGKPCRRRGFCRSLQACREPGSCSIRFPKHCRSSDSRGS